MSERTFRGLGASPGLAIGPVHLVDRRRVKVPRYHVDSDARDEEVQRFERAVVAASAQLDELRTRADERGLSQVGLLLEAHQMILHDEALTGATCRRIQEEGQNAEWALENTIRDLKRLFDRLEQDFFRERRSDVDVVGDRLLRNLTGDRTDPLDELPEGSVVVAHDLSPGDTVALARQSVLGFVTETGGRTSHTAIMARALNVPSVLGVQGLLEQAGAGDRIIVDGRTGEVVLQPPDVVVTRYRSVQRRRQEEARALLADRDLSPETTDGVFIHLFGNVEVSQEIDLVLSHGGEGVGLYRTEFLRLERPDVRTYSEHYEIYRSMLARLGGKPFTIRTFDIGGDKDDGRSAARARERRLSGFGMPSLDLMRDPTSDLDRELNPALGLRAIRLSLRDRRGFREQLKGILLASAHGPVKLLIPFVTVLDELREVRLELERAKAELTEEGRAFDAALPVGIMIETPAAALLADRFAAECDFFSIGTNDLIQYLLACDRANDEVAYLYRSAHPALLRLVGDVARAGARWRIPVTMCGEIAADPFFTPLLIGLGIRALSMSPSSIPVVKRMVRRLDATKCERFAREAASFGTAGEVEGALAERLRSWTPDLLA